MSLLPTLFLALPKTRSLTCSPADTRTQTDPYPVPPVRGLHPLQSDPEHHNVLRLSIRASNIHRIVRTLVHPLPSALRSWVQSSFPSWVLPTNIALKKQKDKGEDDFKREKNTYDTLRWLQGHVIPICYGQIEYDDTRALILSDVGGACLATPEGAVLGKEELKPLLKNALGALAKLGIRHDDIKLDNFHLVGHHSNKIMVVDLERIDALSPGLVDE